MDLGITIQVHSAGAVRDIGIVKAALASLHKEERAHLRTRTLNDKQRREQTTELARQTRVLRGLTLQYGALRRMLLTFGARTVIIGFSSIVAAANAAVVSVGALAASLANLGGAAGIGGGGMLAGVIQGFAVLNLATKDLGKALTTVGQQHKLAMEKLTVPARQFVKETQKLKSSWIELKLIAQKGFFPGALKGLQAVTKLFPILEKRVYNTAQVWGYLAQKTGEMASRRGKQIDTFLRRNARSLQYAGEAAINFGSAFLDAFKVADPFIGKMGKQVVSFSKSVKKAFASDSGQTALAGVLNNLQESWDSWTSTFGHTAKALFNVWDAIQPVVHNVEDSINDASKGLEKWTGGHKNEIRDYFYDALQPMGAFLDLVGALGKSWVKFSEASGDDVTRIFRGLTTKVVPVLEDIFLYLNDNFMPRFLEFGSAFVDFIEAALPGLKAIGSIIGSVVLPAFTGLLTVGEKIITFADNLGTIPGIIATMAVTGTVIASWVSLRRIMGLTLLTARKAVGGAVSAERPTRQQFKEAFLPYRVKQGTKRFVNLRRQLAAEQIQRGAERQSGFPRNRISEVNWRTGTVPNYRDLRPYENPTNVYRDRNNRWRDVNTSKFASPPPNVGYVKSQAASTPFQSKMPKHGQAVGMAGNIMSEFLLTALMVAAPIAIAKVAPMMRSKTAPEAKRANDIFLGAASKDNGLAARRGAMPGANFKPLAGGMRNFAGDIDAAAKSGNSSAFKAVIRHIRDAADASKELGQRKDLRHLAQDVAALEAATTDKLMGKVAGDFDLFAQRGDTSVMKIRDGLAVLQNEIGNKLPAASKAYKVAMAQSFGQAAAEVKAAIDSNLISAKKGMRELTRLTAQQFKWLGFANPRTAAKNYINNKSGDTHNKPVAPGQPVGAAKGAFIGRKGERGRDTVPAMLNGQNAVVAKGEYVGVFNNRQQQAFDGMSRAAGYSGMEGFFASNSKPHYMAGGGIVGLGHKIERMGPYTVSENPAFGGVTPGGHAPNSYHYRNQALDVNADGAPGGEPKWLDRLAAFLKRNGWHYLWQVADHFDHLHVDTANGQGGMKGSGLAKAIKRQIAGGPDSVVRDVAQGALDAVRNAANSSISKAGGSLEGSEFAGGGKPSQDMKLAQRMAASMGWTGNNWTALRKLWMGESGFNHLARNPSSGAYGIPQALPGNKMASAGGDWMTNPATQIEWGLKYIKDRYGSPAQAYSMWLNRNPHWYFGGGLIPPMAQVSGVKPPHFDDPPDVDVPGQKGGKPVTPDPKKKDPKKKNTPPDLAGRMPGSKRGYTVGDFHPKKKHPKVPIRKKIRKLLRKSHLRPPGLMVDPITGETVDPTKGLFAFQFYDKYQEWMDKKSIALTTLQNQHGFSEEEAIVNVNGVDVINQKGMKVDGRFVPGIKQAVDELTSELYYHEGMPFMLQPDKNPGGILGALLAQQSAMKTVHPNKKVNSGRAMLIRIRKAFLANVRVRKAYRKKMNDAKKKKFNWRDAVDANEDIIREWQHWLRDSYGESHGDTRKAHHEIDRLQEQNRALNDKKPKGSPFGSGEMSHNEFIFRQRGEENRRLVGDANLKQWTPGSMGGAAGKVLDSLNAWNSVKDAVDSNLSGLPSLIGSERDTIASIKHSISDWTGTTLPTSSTIGDDSGRDDILKQIGLDTLRGKVIGESRFGTLSQFASLLGQRYVGAFAHGGLVKDTGMALVHKGEYVTPAPDGPFGGNMNLKNDVNVHVTVADETGRVLRIVDSRMKSNATDVSRRQGRNTRNIRSAPGR